MRYAMLCKLVPLLLATSAATIAFPSPSTEASLGANLMRAGLGHEALAAAGVTPAAIAGLIENAQGSDAIAQGTIDSADAAYAAAKTQVDALAPIVQSGQATEQQVADLQIAKAALEDAVASREAALATLFTDTTTTLGSAQRDLLSEIRANSRWRLPTHFLVVSRTEAEWVALRDALAAERSCARIGDELDPQTSAALAAWRAQADVASAKTNLDTNGPAVKTAWESATE